MKLSWAAAAIAVSCAPPAAKIEAVLPPGLAGTTLAPGFHASFLPAESATDGLRDLLDRQVEQIPSFAEGLSPIVIRFDQPIEAALLDVDVRTGSPGPDLEVSVSADGRTVYAWPRKPYVPEQQYALHFSATPAGETVPAARAGIAFAAGDAAKDLLDRAAAVAAGTLSLTRHESGTTDYERLMGESDTTGVAAVAEGTLQIEDLRGARKRGWGEDTPARVAIRVLAAYPAADTGKVVIVQHGAGDSARFVLRTASDYCRVGLPVIGIDIPSQGARSAGETALWDLEDLAATRDHIREGAYDLVQLAKALRAQGKRIRFIGRSLGGMVGTLYLAADPQVEAAVLNQTGGGFGALLREGQFIKDLIGVLFEGFTGLDPFAPPGDEAWEFNRATGQMVLNGGDALVYAPKVKTPRVLVQTSPGDQTLPNSSTERLAAGIPGAQLKSWPMPEDRADLNPHAAYDVVPEMRAEAAAFLAAE
jgi:pimeloyl-ACP methyl ester carboxylesterase